MLDIVFKDWAKQRPKKHYKRLHHLRVFEIIFSEKLFELGIELGKYNLVQIYCLSNPKKEEYYDSELALGTLSIFIPDDYMDFLDTESTEEKFQLFSVKVRRYLVPALEKYSTLPLSTITKRVEEALQEVQDQNYEIVFLVDGTPKKSPSGNKTAILKGIHRSEKFQLRCEVYSHRGRRLIDQLLVEELPNEYLYAEFLGTLNWEGENHIQVKSKTSNWMVEVQLEE